MLLTALLMMAAASPAQADPLAPAARGELECQMPDDLNKSCWAITSYRAVGDGKYISVSEMLVSPQGPVTVQVSSPVFVKGNAVCGKMRREDLAAGRVRIDGEWLSIEEGQPHLDDLVKLMSRFLNKEFCAKYVTTANGMVNKVSMNGTYISDFDSSVRWISARDGYQVEP